MAFKRPISVFDVIGPIMVGPSSSHTAGAVRLGSVGRSLIGGTPDNAKIELHGSFAETGFGHGTDKAIIAGLLGLAPQDKRLSKSLSLAKEAGLAYEFYQTDLGEEFHPNSCRLTLIRGTEKVQYTGSSIGGGLIEIANIEDYPVSFNGSLDCLVVISVDQPGTINKITGWLLEHQVNIAYLTVNRSQRGGHAVLVVQTDQAIPQHLITELRQSPWTLWARYIPKFEE